jgi:hypothetical protein
VSEPIQVAHRCSPQEALERLKVLAKANDIELVPDEDGASGTLTKSLGLLGTVRGRYRIESERIEIALEALPAALGESTVKRLLGTALAEAFGV